MSRLATPLQIDHLKRVFLDLNPGSEEDLIDWRAHLDAKGTMGENVDAFAEAYPQFKWIRPEAVGPGQYEEMVIEGLAEEAEPYGYELIRARRLKDLKRGPARLKKVKIALERCQGLRPERPKRKRKPRKKCKESEKVRVCFNRCSR